jgi:hypothetical protein
MSYHHHNKSTIKKITVVTSGISEHRSVAVGRGNVLIMALVPTCLYIQGPYWLWSHGCWNTAIYVISTYHHWCCQFESRSGQGIHHCDKVCQWLATDRWFSPGPPVSTTNNTWPSDRTEILLKVAWTPSNKHIQSASGPLTYLMSLHSVRGSIVIHIHKEGVITGSPTIYAHIHPLNTNNTMTYNVRNPGPGLG